MFRSISAAFLLQSEIEIIAEEMPSTSKGKQTDGYHSLFFLLHFLQAAAGRCCLLISREVITLSLKKTRAHNEGATNHHHPALKFIFWLQPSLITLLCFFLMCQEQCKVCTFFSIDSSKSGKGVRNRKKEQTRRAFNSTCIDGAPRIHFVNDF